MNRLRELQGRFQRAILAGDRSFEDCIAAGGRIAPAQRIAIYADAYRLRLMEALRDNYPGLHALLGDRAFEQLSRRYIDASPSAFRSIRWYGDALPAFVAEHTDYGAQPVLAEMARLDWDMTLAFDAAETETLGVDGLASVPPDCWGQLRFEFHPSLYRNDFHWSVFEFRAAAERDDPQLSAPERSDNPVPWILWRQGLRVQYRSMAVDEAFTLDAAIRGENFETLCAGLTEWVDEDHAAGRAVAFLKRWLVDELIVGTQV